MNNKDKLSIFRDIFNILLKPLGSSCICQQVYAYELYKYMKEKHKIHPVYLDMHDEMVKLGIAKATKLQLESWDDPQIDVAPLNKEALKAVREAVEQSRDDGKIDISKWAKELAQDICKE